MGCGIMGPRLKITFTARRAAYNGLKIDFHGARGCGLLNYRLTGSKIIRPKGFFFEDNKNKGNIKVFWSPLDNSRFN